MSETIVRPAVDADLPSLTDLYNHYVLDTPVTFDTTPFTVDERRAWFDEHAPTGRHRLFIAEVGPAGVVGLTLYRALFEALAVEDIHRIVAGVTLPNPGSVALHERCGFRQIGVLSSVGRKFDRYWDVAWFERPLRLEP